MSRALAAAMGVAIATAALAADSLEPSPIPTRLPAAVMEVAVESRNLPLPDRIDRISSTLLGADYLLDAAGEGRGHDPDPPARYDAFDCVTFAEEVLALALSGEPIHAASVRQQLRYASGQPGYATRNHFMELQWIPNNIRDGWLQDITTRIGTTRRLRAEVSADTWRGWGRRHLFALTDDQLPVGQMQLDVLPAAQAEAAVDRLPPGALLLTVREPRAGVPLWITHVGLTVPGERPTVRHATRMGEGSVRDHSLAWYLGHIQQAYKNWPVAGVALLLPREQGPRRAALPSPAGEQGDI